uniref:Uncharacterized protein n=1 Tax=Cacopsylla melanoneura TaxID=428564 RepID=A0A8D8ZYP3_9HEMI
MKLKCQQRKICCHAKIVELTVKNNENGDIINKNRSIFNHSQFNKEQGHSFEDLEEKKRRKVKRIIKKQNTRKLMELSANTNLKRLEIEHPCRKKPSIFINRKFLSRQNSL